MKCIVIQLFYLMHSEKISTYCSKSMKLPDISIENK